MDLMYWVLIGGMSLIGMIVSGRLKSKFQQYSQMPVRSNMSGRDLAEAMLLHYDISDVKIVQGKGMLTDHYNPATKTVSLSPHVYHGRNVAAAAVATHECGHAVQHARSYAWLNARSTLVPIMNVATSSQQWLFFAAIMALSAGFGNTLMLVTIAAFSVTALFSFVTLPVEFDASRRALIWLDETGVAKGAEYDGAKDALWWAAMTYVSAALSALVMVLYLVMRFAGANDD